MIDKREWGWMVKFIHTKKFWFKFLRVKGRTSLQSHNERVEYHFGLYKVNKGEKHRMQHGWFFELATGKPDENDIIRYSDDYDRIKTVAVSGGFDPVHKGHISMFKEAKKLGRVVVLLNSDQFLIKKKRKPFMNYEGRKEVLESIKYVDEVLPVIDEDTTVCKSLEKYRPDIFANGGDRIEENIPEKETCDRLGIELAFCIGGGKTESSSNLLNTYNHDRSRR